jgi:catechol 2,3-dioxygenase-like lactoylglutathione lyase family enzyme
MTAQIDHIVIACASLDQAVAYSERVLGVTPGAGGEHPLMSTHNRLILGITDKLLSAYIEFIAINPEAPKPAQPRWFGLDNPALQAQISAAPKLVHFVASVTDIDHASTAVGALSYPSGAIRDITRADYRWRMTITPDGEQHEAGLIPTLIQWSSVHPTSRMPQQGVSLQEVRCEHPDIERIRAAHEAIGLTAGVSYASASSPRLRAALMTPRGAVSL